MLSDLKPSSFGSAVFYILKCEVATKKNGERYYRLQLRDKSGVFKGVVWSDADYCVDVQDGIFISADYTVSEYNGEMQIILTHVYKAAEGSYDLADYVPVSPEDESTMFRYLLKYLDEVKDPDYKALIQLVLGDSEFNAKIKTHSAAVSVHHAFICGWLQHTLSVVRLCYAYTKQYPQLHTDLLLTAAFLHDLGKFYEISAFPENQYTDEGYYFGHIVYGTHLVNNLIQKLNYFPKEKSDALLHCILSHHGELEYGSPKKPVLLEALALHLADLTDSRLEIFIEAVDKIPENKTWSDRNYYLGTSIRKTDL